MECLFWDDERKLCVVQGILSINNTNQNRSFTFINTFGPKRTERRIQKPGGDRLCVDETLPITDGLHFFFFFFFCFLECFLETCCPGWSHTFSLDPGPTSTKCPTQTNDHKQLNGGSGLDGLWEEPEALERWCPTSTCGFRPRLHLLIKHSQSIPAVIDRGLHPQITKE